MQVTSRYHIGYLKQKMIRRIKLYNRIRHIRAYLTAKYKKRVKPDYVKGQLDPLLELDRADLKVNHDYALRRSVPRKKNHQEHPYFKPLHYL